MASPTTALRTARRRSTGTRRPVAVLAVLGLVGAMLVSTVTAASVSAVAYAATGPGATPTTQPTAIKSVVDPSTSGVTADALPTAQIDGVVWSEAVAGDTVYAGGDFANARPAGSAPGVNTVARSNLLAFSISTGVLNTSFAPTINAQVKAVAVSPDGSTLYVGGSFTQVNGVTANRLAAFNISTGALITSFAPSLNATVSAIAVTNSTVYVGGAFTSANGVTRNRIAAFAVAGGGLTTWNPSADASVNALVITPDGSRVIAGGTFANMGGQAAYGLAALNAATGTLMTWNAANTVKDAGPNAAILSLTTDGTAIYGTGYVYGTGGNFEGAFSADPNSGTLNWVEDCHGDSYDTFATGSQVYVVSHEHFCGNIGAFPETLPRTWHRATAFTNKATGTVTADPSGANVFGGLPAPSMVNWFPDLAVGTKTGQSQAAWTITGNSTYVVLGGEFPTVNGTAQQGLVRFATKPTAPSKQTPRVTGAAFVPRILPVSPTALNLYWQPNWERDATQLTYKLVLNGATSSPLWTGTIQSTFWNRQVQTLAVTGLSPGTAYSFRLYATDPSGNTTTGNAISYTTPSTTPPLATYSARVLSDGASAYYPLDEASGVAPKDYVAFNDGQVTGTTASTATGALAGDGATSLTGTTVVAQSTYIAAAPSVYTEQVWIRTTTTAGGPIMEFGNSTATTTGSHDREVYMGTDGRVTFSVNTGQGAFASISSPGPLNDGQWHQVTATEGSSGTALYIDGLAAGTTTAHTSPGNNYAGLWRLGAENLNGSWPLASNSTSFSGDLAGWAIYPTAVSADAVQNQYVASGRTITPVTPVTPTYASTVTAAGATNYYRLDDPAGTSAKDSIGGNNAVITGSDASTATGAVGTNAATSLTGTTVVAQNAATANAPAVYTQQIWIRSTTTAGGLIMEFGSQTGTTAFSHDREVYMGTDGRVTFSVYTAQSTFASITSANALNDGQWHQITATEGDAGTALYIDGAVAGTNTSRTSPSNNYAGYWRVGAEALNGSWPMSSNSPSFAGDVDEWAIYPTALSAATVQSIYAARTQG